MRVRLTIFAVTLAVIASTTLVTPIGAQNEDVLLLVGEARTDLLSKLAKALPTADAMEVVDAARENAADREAHITMLREKLRDVHAIALDLAALEIGDPHRLLMEAARAEAVPVVFQHADGEKMKDLVGGGITAPLVVAEHEAGTGVTHLHIFGGLTVAKGMEDDQQELPIDDTATSEHEGEEEEEEEENPDAIEKAHHSLDDGDPRQNPGDLFVAVFRILQQQRYSNGGAAQHVTSHAYTGLGICNGAPNCNEYVTHWHQHSHSTTNTVLGPQVRWARFRGTIEDYVVVRLEGRVGANLKWNVSDDRGYFVEFFEPKASIVGWPTGSWVLAKSAPPNQNDQSTIASTTGFTVTATGGASGKQPTGSLAAGYSQSSTRTMNLSDFKVVNHEGDSPNIRWSFDLSKVDGRYQYNNWKSLIDKQFMDCDLRNLPTMSSNGFQYISEGVWRGPKNARGSFKFNIRATVRVRNTWLRGAFDSKWRTRSYSFWVYNTSPFWLSF